MPTRRRITRIDTGSAFDNLADPRVKIPLEFEELELHNDQPEMDKRILAIDFARGIAVTLMILSHGIKGLLSFEQFPSWGLVPIHLITKFSSTLFFLVFGVALAVAFLPYVDTDKWPAKRRRLMIRAVVILFWYKVLTIVEMFHLYSRQDILKTLMYESFTVYTEILGFYGLALLWIPWALTLWKRAPLFVQLLIPPILVGLTIWLGQTFSFWNSAPLRAIFVEHEDFYTWGQLSRAPLVFSGVLLGQALLYSRKLAKGKLYFLLGLSALSAGTFAYFYYRVQDNISQAFYSIALNQGKHPPELNFMLFSISGALLIFALSYWGGNKLAQTLKPITIIGKDALNAFIFHIFVIFVFYRYLFDYWQKITYQKAMVLTIVLILLTALWIRIKDWVSEQR